MKILVTGGAGFIGSNFIRYILKKYPGYKITNLDKLTYAGNPNNLRDVERKYTGRYFFVKGDIGNRKIVNKLAKKNDCILNFAAETHVDRSILGADSFVKTDVYGTYILLEAARKHNHRRYIQVSTDEVYGSIARGSFSEESPLKPNSPYSASKASADLLCHAYFATFKLAVIIVRSANNFGPYQYPEKIIPLFVTNALEDKPLPIYGDGKNVRDWLYVLDNCRAIDLILHKGKEGEIYNVGGGNELTNLQLTKKIVRILSRGERSTTQSLKHRVVFVADRPGHDRRYSLDCRKIKKELDWFPQYSFEDALKKTISWYKDNYSWWLGVKRKQKQFENLKIKTFEGMKT